MAAAAEPKAANRVGRFGALSLSPGLGEMLLKSILDMIPPPAGGMGNIGQKDIFEVTLPNPDFCTIFAGCEVSVPV